MLKCPQIKMEITQSDSVKKQQTRQYIYISVEHEPVIETCRLRFEGTGGVVFISSFVGNTTSCDDTRDTFVNLQPRELHFEFSFSFRLPEDPPAKHKYVHDFHFGIIDGNATLQYYSKTGGNDNDDDDDDGDIFIFIRI